MKVRLARALAGFGLLLFSAPGAVGQPARPPSPAAVSESLQGFGAWVQQITDAMAPSNEAGMVYARKLQELTKGSDPAQLVARLPEVRAAISELRQALIRSDTLLARIPDLENPLPGISAEHGKLILGGARSQITALRQQAVDAEELVAALERGDQAAVQKAAPKLVRAGFVHLRGQATMYRARREILPANRSPHYMASVTVSLYEAMSIAAESWYAARIEGRKTAAAEQGAQFTALALQLENEVRTGRAILAKEMTGVAAVKRNFTDPKTVELLVAAEGMGASVGEAFVIGDDLVTWLRSSAGTTQEALQTQNVPALIFDLGVIEQRYVAVSAKMAKTLAQPAG
jgi:hypothetical protein